MKKTIALCLSFIILASLFCTASVFASNATSNETIEDQIMDVLSEFASCVYGLDYGGDLTSLFIEDSDYVVVSTENPYGYNDLSTIIVAAHTTDYDNYSLNALSYVGYSEDEFALIRIASWQSGS